MSDWSDWNVLLAERDMAVTRAEVAEEELADLREGHDWAVNVRAERDAALADAKENYEIACEVSAKHLARIAALEGALREYMDHTPEVHRGDYWRKARAVLEGK